MKLRESSSECQRLTLLTTTQHQRLLNIQQFGCDESVWCRSASIISATSLDGPGTGKKTVQLAPMHRLAEVMLLTVLDMGHLTELPRQRTIRKMIGWILQMPEGEEKDRAGKARELSSESFCHKSKANLCGSYAVTHLYHDNNSMSCHLCVFLHIVSKD